MATIQAVIQLIRPKTLIWFCIATCLGFVGIVQREIPNPDFFFLLLSIMFANIGAIITNDIGDVMVDSYSQEISKRSRPIVTGTVKMQEAKILASIFYLLSIIISVGFGWRATLFVIVIILFSLTYSLPPTKFSSRPFWSIFYWILLCIVCYLLMLNALSTPERSIYQYFQYTPGWIFISGIIFYMGIAEIISKDLRDLTNDEKGGRKTFVLTVGSNVASRVMLLFTWLGLILWFEALYLSVDLSANIAALGCIIVGFLWCSRITVLSFKLSERFNQPLAANLHQHWTYAYAVMQILTFLTFI